MVIAEALLKGKDKRERGIERRWEGKCHCERTHITYAKKKLMYTYVVCTYSISVYIILLLQY